MWIYLNDRFVSEEEATISIFDYGFLYGDGLFETLRAYGGKIFALPQHLKRISDSADRLQLSIPSHSLLTRRLNETLDRNILKEALLRLTLTRGKSQAILRPDLCGKGTLIITARPFYGLPLNQYDKGISSAIVSIQRASPAGRETSIKSLNFLNNILAKLEITGNNLFEGIFLDGRGFLSEGTVSNLFFVKKGVLITPAISGSVLEGVTRNIVIELAKKEGISVEEGCYQPKELFAADEAFLTNTGIEVLPLVLVDQRGIGSGQPGPMTRKLHHLYQEKIRRECR